MKTIIFLSGVMMYNWLAKSKFMWDQDHWYDYNCLWIPCRIPYSDMMVRRELDRLQGLLENHPGAVFAGQSLGAWWAANLANRCDISKLVLWTPLVDTRPYFFNVTQRYHPCNAEPRNKGLSKVLVTYGSEDLIVPHQQHAYYDVVHFQAMTYKLQGGHLFQKNHQAALKYMKDWIETP